MALVESIDIPLGTLMPAFRLPDPSGKHSSSTELMGEKGLLVVFTCNHCPYAIPQWPRFILLAKYAKKIGVGTVAINPNIHPAYPEDAPAKMQEKIGEWKIPFPYLIDESQDVAKSYKAQCTPDPYLFAANKKLVYHGRLDDSWQNATKVTTEELKIAIDCLVTGKPINSNQKPAMGCSIKWQN